MKGKEFWGQNVDFFLEIMVWWYHGGTMVPTPYLPPTYPLPTPSLWGGEIVVFPQEISIFWVRICYTCKKLFVRVNPCFPPSRLAGTLRTRLQG